MNFNPIYGHWTKGPLTIYPLSPATRIARLIYWLRGFKWQPESRRDDGAK